MLILYKKHFEPCHGYVDYVEVARSDDKEDLIYEAVRDCGIDDNVRSLAEQLKEKGVGLSNPYANFEYRISVMDVYTLKGDFVAFLVNENTLIKSRDYDSLSDFEDYVELVQDGDKIKLVLFKEKS